MPKGKPLLKGPQLKTVPSGTYSAKIVGAMHYNQLIFEITSKPYTGQRFLIKMPPFHLEVIGERVELRSGYREYSRKKIEELP